MNAKDLMPAGAETGNSLLIDISNSYTKVGWANDHGLMEKRRFPTPQLNSLEWTRLLQGWEYDRAVLCSVVPAHNETARAATGIPTLLVRAGMDLGFEIDYPDPDSIGADRLANAAAMMTLGGGPAVVVDFGTAVTFDLIDPRNAYVGGIIAPGLEMMTEGLHRRTALLPEIELDEPGSVIGKSTSEAMKVGAVIGYRGLVREILNEVKQQAGFGPEIRVVATGGYASLIAARLPEIKQVEPDLTLLGLLYLARRNFIAGKVPR